MGMTIFRPGQRLIVPNARVLQPGMSAAATLRWLVGGISAADVIGAYEAKGAASLAASYINLNNPGTYNCTAPVSAPTFNTSDGWTFSGTAGNYLLAATLANESSSIIVKFSSFTPGTNKCLVGGFINSGGNAAFLIQSSSAVLSQFYNGTNTANVTAAVETSGIYAVAGKSVYKNNNTVAATIPAGTFSASLSCAIGSLLLNNGSGISAAAVKIQAVYFYSKILSSAEIAAQMATGIAAV